MSAPTRPADGARASIWESKPARFLGSYGLAITILCLLLLITFLGTWDQRTRAIYDVQKDYFESWIHVSNALPIPIPVFGAVPLLGLLFVNLLVGGMIRLRKGRSTVGILVAHIGIAVLLLGGLVEHTSSLNGSMYIPPGQERRTFQSYHDWDVVLTAYGTEGRGTRYWIQDEILEEAGPSGRTTFHHASLPFELVLDGYRRNGRPIPVTPGRSGAVDGWMLQEGYPMKKAEENLPIVRVTVRVDGIEGKRLLLWGLQDGPAHFEVGGEKFGLDMRRREFELPFSIQLDRFVKADHPGVDMAREYSSYVQRIQNGVSENVHITMNEPLRHEGYILYQSSYQQLQDLQGRPVRDADGRPVFATILTVSQNPADRIPLLACIIISLGLLIHFIRKLVLHIKAESRKARHATT